MFNKGKSIQTTSCSTAGQAQVEKDSSSSETLDISSKPSYTLGRADTCDLVIPDSAASRSHAAIVHHSDGRAFLIDLKSVRTERKEALHEMDTKHHCQLPELIW